MKANLRTNLYRLPLLVAGVLALGLTRSNIAHALTGPYPASDVLGQTDGSGFIDFTNDQINNGKSPIDGTSLSSPSATAIDTVNHRLFAVDMGNERILVYNLDSYNNLIDHTADNVLGQDDMNSSNHGQAQDRLYTPVGVAYDSVHNRLFAIDLHNNRVVIYDLSNGITDGLNPVSEFGQADWGQDQRNRGGSVGPDGLSDPGVDLVYDAGHNWLYVSDQGNHRILIYDLSTGIDKGRDATYVLGQTSMTVADGSQVSQSHFTTIYGLAYDEVHQRLFASDAVNNRVLVYDMSGSVTNGMNASWLIGQDGWSDIDDVFDKNRVDYPSSLAYDSVNQRLYVATGETFRVSIFDVSTIDHFEDAVALIGAEDYSTSASCSPVTDTNLCFISGAMSYDSTNNRLWVPVGGQNRILAYDFVHTSSDSGDLTLPQGALGQPYSQTINLRGMCVSTMSMTGGALPQGLSFNASTGVISGTPTSVGTYTFEISSSDDCGVLGIFVEDPPFTITIPAPAGVPDTGLAPATRPMTLVFYSAISAAILGWILNRFRDVK